MGVPQGLNLTDILWARYSWNPYSGCSAVSDECEFCYAKLIAERWAGTSAFPNGFEFTLRPHRMDAPKRLADGAVIFANSMSDPYWSHVPGTVREAQFQVMEETPRHVYMMLTKRAGQMQRHSEIREFPPNVWAGVSIGRRAHLKRLDKLRNTAAAVRFISLGPLLEDIGRFALGGIHMVIVEGESGGHLRNKAKREDRGMSIPGPEGLWQPDPRKVERVRRLRDMCLDAGVAFFFKQWGGPFDHAAGRELDGRTWEQYPVPLPHSMLNPAIFSTETAGQGELVYERVDA